MQSATTKEHTMKRLSTRLIPLAAVAAYFATVADSAFAGLYSDERLKREIAPVEGALARLSRLETR
jgi:hypothetical protein